MPLPLDTCADNISEDVCCRDVFDVADRLRCIATDAVECCIDPSCADREWRSYVSVGPRIAEPLGDALVVHMPNISPSTGSRGSASLLPAAVHIANFEVFLTENGWPMITANEYGEVIQVPDSALINKIALHAYSHGERMYRALCDAVQRRTAFPPSTNPHIGTVLIGGMNPVQPAAFTVGWTVPIQIQMTFPPLFEEGS